MVYIFVNAVFFGCGLFSLFGVGGGMVKLFFNLILGVVLWEDNHLLLLLSQCCAPSLLCLWCTLP